MLRFGVRAYGLGLRVSGSELRVQFRVEGLGLRLKVLRVWSLRLRFRLEALRDFSASVQHGPLRFF